MTFNPTETAQLSRIALSEALEQLTPYQSLLLWLSISHTQHEIAIMLDVSRSTVDTLLRRIRGKLSAILS